jgi:hypothetical protein
MKSQHFILMGDIVGSSEYEAEELRKEFLQLISLCNKSLEKQILSPYTVTLGDEFQGIAKSLPAVLETLFFLEETSLQKHLLFKIRYVTVQGRIDTPLNRDKAYTMMGPGLTLARKILTDKKRGVPRFRFVLKDKYLMNQINRLFLVIDGLTEKWNIDDAQLILNMLADTNNENVGKKQDKNRTQIWKRRKNLMIEEYRALKKAIFQMVQLQR